MSAEELLEIFKIRMENAEMEEHDPKRKLKISRRILQFILEWIKYHPDLFTCENDHPGGANTKLRSSTDSALVVISPACSLEDIQKQPFRKIFLRFLEDHRNQLFPNNEGMEKVKYLMENSTLASGSRSRSNRTDYLPLAITDHSVLHFDRICFQGTPSLSPSPSLPFLFLLHS